MAATTETETVHTIFSLARQLSVARRRWIAELLSRETDEPLPAHATLDEAVAVYLLDACSLGQAAELADVTRWDIQDRLRELHIPISVVGEQSAQESDALAEQLRNSQ